MTPVVPSENVVIIEEKLENLKLTCPITLSESSIMILLIKKKNGASIETAFSGVEACSALAGLC